MENNNSPFRFTKHIQQGIPLSTEEKKEFSPYLMCRMYYYAGYEKMANLLNMLWSLPKEFQYKIFCILFAGVYPKGWIKSTKKKEPEQLEIEFLKKKYQVSTNVAKEYAELLTKEEKKEIKRRFE